MSVMYNVQRWAGGQIFTMKSEAVGWPSVVSDDLVQSVDKKFVKDGASQFKNFHEFLQILRTVKLHQTFWGTSVFQPFFDS
jgi:hypothetical protein